MDKTVLIYGLKGPELLKLLPLCKAAGIRCKAVSDSKTRYTVDELLSDRELSSQDPFPLSGKYALLDGFSGNLGEISSIINQVCPGVIKAVHTEHNGSWRFSDLCFAILQEHNTIEMLKKNKK